MSTITAQNFDRMVNKIGTQGEALRELVQDLLVYALQQYAQPEGSHTNSLTAVLTACVGVKALPTKTIKAYIQAHANVSWRKSKDGVLRFGKAGKTVEVTMPTVTWYDFSKAHQATEDKDMMLAVKSWINNTQKLRETGKIKEGQEDFADKVVMALAALLPATEQAETVAIAA